MCGLPFLSTANYIPSTSSEFSDIGHYLVETYFQNPG